MDLSLKFEFEDLHEHINSVNNGGVSVHQTTKTDNGREIEISISPYTIGQNNNGVVISMRELK